MNRLIAIAAVCIIINTVHGVSYEYDYDYSEDTEDKPLIEEKAPIYDLKDAPKLFEKFIKDYHKEYKDKLDYSVHYQNFISNLKYINEVNKQAGTSSSDINLFSDLGDAELSIIG